MRPWLPVALSSVMSVPAAAAGDLTVAIEVPSMSVAEYHRPYLAVWVEKPDQSVAANLAVWYSMKGNNEGTKWLKDLRTWWRRSGRDLAVPVDGLTGATRAPGRHELTFSAAKGALASLAPGSYQLVIEAAREVGGREVVKVPFTWPAPAAATATAKGSTELGVVTVNVRP